MRAPLLALFLPAIAAAAPDIETRTLAEVAIHPERSAQAQVVSLNESRIAAEIAARIVELPLQPGQVIARGALLARLDCRDYDLAAERAAAALQVSEARARLAELQSERARKLAGDGFIAGELLDTRLAEAAAARAEVGAAQAALKTAENVRGKCVLRTPFPAIVAERLGQEGEMATAGAPLAVLIDRSHIELKAEVQEADAADLALARAPRFVAQEGEFPLRLLRTSPALNKATRQVEARLGFVKRTPRPGSGGRLVWASATPHLPAALLVRRQGVLGVFIEETGKPRFVPLAGAQEGRPVPVDLPPSTRLVVKGQHTLP
jgi:RND family efflux transporter MFP subunit